MPAAKHVAALPYIAHWSNSPIPNFSLSASGLLALADLQTVSNRTAIAGGSSWLDALVLAPGLHYEQAANAVYEAEVKRDAIEETPGDAKNLDYAINNMALLNYLKKVQKNGRSGDITLDIGMDSDTQMERIKKTLRAILKRQPKRRITDSSKDVPQIDWFSNVLYLASPLLTAVAITFMILLRDWWGFATIIGLMLSRILNIFTIKLRVSSASPQSGSLQSPGGQPAAGTRGGVGGGGEKHPSLPSTPTTAYSGNSQIAQYYVDIGNGRKVILRGSRADLQAVTTHQWMRDKTHIDGFFEAGAKLLVYLVAAFSGNCTQAGNIIQLTLLVVSAALLGLSNAHSTGFSSHGRRARVEQPPMKQPPAGGQLGEKDVGQGVEVWRMGTGQAGVKAYSGRDEQAGGFLMSPGVGSYGGHETAVNTQGPESDGSRRTPPPPSNQGTSGGGQMRTPRESRIRGSGQDFSAWSSSSGKDTLGGRTPVVGGWSSAQTGQSPRGDDASDPFIGGGRLPGESAAFDHGNPYSPIHQRESANRAARRSRYDPGNHSSTSQFRDRPSPRQEPPRRAPPPSWGRLPGTTTTRTGYDLVHKAETLEDEEINNDDNDDDDDDYNRNRDSVTAAPLIGYDLDRRNDAGYPAVYNPDNQPVVSSLRVKGHNSRYSIPR